jgi:long-chain acyl-CoA synthetase
MFYASAARFGAGVLMRQKELGIWKSYSWGAMTTIVEEMGLGLLALGFEPGETASILSNTNREWVWSDLAILAAGGVSSGIYPTDAAAQVEYLLTDSRSVYAFVEDDEQLDKILEVRARVPLLRKVIVFDMEGLRELDDPQVMSLEALRALGRANRDKLMAAWQARRTVRKAQDLAILIYTSGTTGRPKGAMLSHANVMAAVRAANSVYAQSTGDERISFLPLCHVAERIGGLYGALATGTKLNFVESPETVPENLREIAPTVFFAVPRIWEKLYSGVLIALAEATPLERAAYHYALRIGQTIAQSREAGRRAPLWARLAFPAARFLVLDNVRKAIGVHRARMLVTSAAPISPDLVRWYMALGFDMLEVWGQTECGGPATSTLPGVPKPGSIGKAIEGVEVKLSPDNELLIRGECVFMGYLNQPDKTAETVRDGWLHTGDVGRQDDQGYLYITDRMKDIIITAGGKNITPSEIENQLKFSPYITDAVVIGDRRAFLTALIMIDHENVEKYAQDRAIPFSNYASLCRRPEIIALIQGEIDRVNKQFARVESIRKFRLIEQKLTAEDEELTPTMKLKRSFVNKKYHDLIESMYSRQAA